jgi:hypothetical protein
MHMNIPIDSNANKSLKASLAKLSELADRQPDIWLRMLRAYGSKFYPVDLLAIGALNRSAAFPEATFIEVIEAFCAATELFHTYVEGWIYSKSNPDIMAKRRAARKTKL